MARVCLRRGFRVMAAEKTVWEVELKRETKLGLLGFLALAFASSFVFLGYGIVATFFTFLNVRIPVLLNKYIHTTTTEIQLYHSIRLYH